MLELNASFPQFRNATHRHCNASVFRPTKTSRKSRSFCHLFDVFDTYLTHNDVEYFFGNARACGSGIVEELTSLQVPAACRRNCGAVRCVALQNPCVGLTMETTRRESEFRFEICSLWPTTTSSSRMRVIYHNWSATKQRPHPQSVAEISHHSVLSGDRIRQCDLLLLKTSHR